MTNRATRQSNVRELNHYRKKAIKPQKKKKRRKSGTIGSGFFWSIILLVMIYNIAVLNHQAQIRDVLKAKAQQTNAVHSQLTEKIRMLEHDITKIGTLEYIEKVAREEYDMTKPREIIYKVKKVEGEVIGD